ncbi:MAG TPA: asparagine synthase (glutamine-hydrolyzing) [Bacteroidetes bacterium]|nr:asparagine synthase (glutamine-hydrolyzing) [Bacteroidota bacterium]
MKFNSERMCGITGFIDKRKISEKEHLIAMTDVLQHRGPDHRGYEMFDLENLTIGLGHRRLSIIDLSTSGNQPMFTEDKNYCIILNGEIYNYKEIKEELKQNGEFFFSTSDTEVVLKAYRHWGIDFVEKLIGMFAFVIYDKTNNKVLIYRDRAGIKPLYYYFKDGIFLFASEIKSLLKHPAFEKRINRNALVLFFKHGYIDSPYTIYENCYKLKPGNFIEYNLDFSNFKIKKYWDVIDFYNKPKLKIDYHEAIYELENLFDSAFNYRMIADVPVGVFLSSGYDSTTVAAILSRNMKIHTFTIGFNDKKYDESEAARAISKHLGTIHHEEILNENNFKEIADNLAFYYDEPFGDSSALPSILVSKLAKHKVKVALSADGGDELFAGYPKHYQHLSLYKNFLKTPRIIRKLLSPIQTLKRFSHRPDLFSAKNLNDILRIKLETLVFNPKELSQLVNFEYSELKTGFDDFYLLNDRNDFLNKLLAIDYKTYLENDILTKMDRATMSVSLEGREPLLDHRIIEFTARLNSKFKYKKQISKKILKDINKKYIDPKLMHSKKMGFGGPVNTWLKYSLRKDMKELIHANDFPNHLINKEYVSQFYDEFLNNTDNVWWYKVYQIYVFLKWHRYWFSKKHNDILL